MNRMEFGKNNGTGTMRCDRLPPQSSLQKVWLPVGTGPYALNKGFLLLSQNRRASDHRCRSMRRIYPPPYQRLSQYSHETDETPCNCAEMHGARDDKIAQLTTGMASNLLIGTLDTMALCLHHALSHRTRIITAPRSIVLTAMPGHFKPNPWATVIPID